MSAFDPSGHGACIAECPGKPDCPADVMFCHAPDLRNELRLAFGFMQRYRVKM